MGTGGGGGVGGGQCPGGGGGGGGGRIRGASGGGVGRPQIRIYLQKSTCCGPLFFKGNLSWVVSPIGFSVHLSLQAYFFSSWDLCKWKGSFVCRRLLACVWLCWVVSSNILNNAWTKHLLFLPGQAK